VKHEKITVRNKCRWRTLKPQGNTGPMRPAKGNSPGEAELSNGPTECGETAAGAAETPALPRQRVARLPPHLARATAADCVPAAASGRLRKMLTEQSPSSSALALRNARPVSRSASRTMATPARWLLTGTTCMICAVSAMPSRCEATSDTAACAASPRSACVQAGMEWRSPQ